MLAKVVSAFNEISGGRVDLRLGAGAAPGFGIEKPRCVNKSGAA